MTDIYARNPNVLPVVRVKDGGVFANSRDVAAYFHKKHFHVLEKYDRLDCSAEFAASNFRLSTYIDESGKENRSIDMTRDGFAFVVFGFTGKRAAKFKEDFLAEFNAMEAEITHRRMIDTSPAQGALALTMDTNQSLANIERQMHTIHTGLGAKMDALVGAVIGSIRKHVGTPILERMDENQRWNEMRFQAIHARDKLLIQSLDVKRDADECVSIAVAQTMMGVPASRRSSRLSRNLSANAVRWFVARGYTARPDTSHASGPWIFQKSKVAEWWAASGKGIYQREMQARPDNVVAIGAHRTGPAA